MAEANDQMIKWLNDAHALEVMLAPILERHAKDADRPEIADRIREHAEETERHAEMLASRIEALGGSVSKAKELVGKGSGFLDKFATAPFGDKQAKNAAMDYASEHFEIATYRLMAAAAEAVGDSETADLAEAILADEEAMVGWLEEQLPVMGKESVKELTAA